MATTDSSGDFTVTGVATGVHTAMASHPGYLSSEDASVPCQAGQTTQMPETTLVGGDANNDGQIDLFDLVIVAAVYRSCAGDPNFDSQADVNETGCVDIFDLVLVASNYRDEGPKGWPATSAVTTSSTFTFGDNHAVGIAAREQAPQPLSEAETWEVRVAGVQNMYGIDVTLTYDPALISVIDADPKQPGVQIVPGPLYAGRPHLVADNRVLVDGRIGTGTIVFAATLLHPARAISDSGTVLVVPFELMASPLRAASAFAIRDVLVVDQRGSPLPMEWSGGVIRQVFPIHRP